MGPTELDDPEGRSVPDGFDETQSWALRCSAVSFSESLESTLGRPLTTPWVKARRSRSWEDFPFWISSELGRKDRGRASAVVDLSDT
jgi:hypothetical protein